MFSPLDSINGLTTPELSRGGDLPFLFEEGGEGRTFSPTRFSLDLGLEESTLPAPTYVEEGPTVLGGGGGGEGKESTMVKDRFNGTRNTTIKAIPLDAPTMSRTYVIPSATSRKRAPSIPRPSTVTTKKRARRASTPGLAAYEGTEEPFDPEELPVEILSAIEIKRRSNTLAARKSRNRKTEFLQGLQGEIEALKGERDEWREKAQRLEEVVRALRGC